MKKLIIFTCMILSLFAVTSCQHKHEQENIIGPYGKYIEEDLTTTNIVDDNYRNYYEIFVGSFYDTNNDKIGDLNGVTVKLDYIKNLGFNGIWLMPINVSPSYHKYDVKDYYKIDPKYGSLSDLKNLIKECHKRDIKLIMDLVINHSSKQNEWFMKSCEAYAKFKGGFPLTDEENKFKDFYSFYDKKPNDVVTYQAPGYDFYYEGNFSSDMPEFNLDSPFVQDEIKRIVKFYLDLGIDGFRLDAVKYYYYNSEEKNIKFLNNLNKWVKELNSEAYVVAEAWDISEEGLKNYYQSGIDSFFNFNTSISNPNSNLINSLNLQGAFCYKYFDAQVSNIEIANGYIPAPFINNHDTPRYCAKKSTTTTKFVNALMQLMNGSTFTYYGDEVGMVGTNSGSSNPDQNVRIAMKWGEENNKGNCNSPVGTTVTEYPHGTVLEQMNDKNSLYNYYKKLLLLRNQNPEIARGVVEKLLVSQDEASVIIKKTWNNSTIGIIINFSPFEDLQVDYNTYGFKGVKGQLVIDQSKEKYIGLQEDGSIKLPPYSIAIVK